MKDLMKYNSVKLWIKKSCSSEVTEKNYLRKFGYFLEHIDSTNPDEIIEQWKRVRYDWNREGEIVCHECFRRKVKCRN